MPTSRKPVPVAAFAGDRGTIIAVLDDGSVWWTTQSCVEDGHDAWMEAAPIPGTVITYIREEKIEKGER